MRTKIEARTFTSPGFLNNVKFENCPDMPNNGINTDAKIGIFPELSKFQALIFINFRRKYHNKKSLVTEYDLLRQAYLRVKHFAHPHVLT